MTSQLKCSDKLTDVHLSGMGGYMLTCGGTHSVLAKLTGSVRCATDVSRQSFHMAFVVMVFSIAFEFYLKCAYQIN